MSRGGSPENEDIALNNGGSDEEEIPERNENDEIGEDGMLQREENDAIVEDIFLQREGNDGEEAEDEILQPAENAVIHEYGEDDEQEGYFSDESNAFLDNDENIERSLGFRMFMNIFSEPAGAGVNLIMSSPPASPTTVENMEMRESAISTDQITPRRVDSTLAAVGASDRDSPTMESRRSVRRALMQDFLRNRPPPRERTYHTVEGNRLIFNSFEQSNLMERRVNEREYLTAIFTPTHSYRFLIHHTVLFFLVFFFQNKSDSTISQGNNPYSRVDSIICRGIHEACEERSTRSRITMVSRPGRRYGFCTLHRE